MLSFISSATQTMFKDSRAEAMYSGQGGFFAQGCQVRSLPLNGLGSPLCVNPEHRDRN